MRGIMSRQGAVNLFAICLSWLPGPLNATRGATPAKLEPHHGTGSSSAGSLSRLLDYDLPLPHDWIRNSQMDINVMSYSYSYSYSYSFANSPNPSETASRTATPAKLEPHHGTSGSSSVGSLSRLLDYDLPLPHDWIRNSQMDINVMSYSYSYSYSYSFANSPNPSETASRTTTLVLAPKARNTPGKPSQPDEIPIVTIVLLLAGSPNEQKEVIATIITYLKAYMQQLFGQNVEITTGAPKVINLRHRILQSVSKGRFCTTDAPQDEKSIKLRNYDNMAQVQDILAGIMNGTIVLTAVKEDGTSIEVKDFICRAETILVPLLTETFDDAIITKDGNKPWAPLYTAFVIVAGVNILFAAVFLARRHMVSKPRSAIVLSS